MEAKQVKIKRCTLNLGELHRLRDFKYFSPVFECIGEKGEEFKAKMRLHISEPLDRLVIVDPRAYADGGYQVNSVGSSILRRRNSFGETTPRSPVRRTKEARSASLLEICGSEIKQGILQGYDFEAEAAASQGPIHEIAFTCHDPNIIGGGNTILFRLVNWLTQLGIRVTVYSCGSLPAWTRVEARFACFENYETMFAAIRENVVVLYSMWHIEPMLKAGVTGKRIYHLRQIYEPFHYGDDYASTMADKPAITLLESLPLEGINISPHLQDFYEKVNPHPGSLVTNGIDHRVFYPAFQAPATRTFKRILSVGDPEHFVKGGHVLEEALQILGRRRPDLVIEWLILSGARRKTRKKIADNVTVRHLAGLSPGQMRRQYQGANIFVNAALYEGFGLPTIEAMACGVPVVQADNRGLDFLVEHERNCLMVPAGDAPATAQALEKLIDQPALCEALRKEGFSLAAECSLGRQFEAFVPVFSEILGLVFSPEKTKEICRNLARAQSPRASKDSAGDGDAFCPLISVVIPTYNQADYLREALESLLAQTYWNWEAVVMNDGSTDHTQAVMDEYAQKDARIRPFSKRNGGITSALNAGLKKARGDFFCWLSSDDLFYPTKLELQVKAYEQLDDSYALVYGNFDILNGDIGKLEAQPARPSHMAGAEFPEALKFDFIDGCTIMIRMQVMREVGGFNPYYRHSQDMELWIRIASRGYRFWMLQQKLTVRRVHTAQSSTVNMIHCRYDAACMINYYLEHFHLLELYRYFDFNSAAGIARFSRHFVGRMTETEGNINNPLLQEKFWNWFISGLQTLPEKHQNIILRNCLVEIFKHRQSTRRMDFYLARCLAALRTKKRFVPARLDLTVDGRDIRYDNRQEDSFAHTLFEYGTDLLVNSTIPLFGQELYFHNTNKVVDTPRKLGHSALRYLAQFPNPYQEKVKPYSAIEQVPETEEAALTIYCKLRFPRHAEAMLVSHGADGDIEAADAAIAACHEELRPLLAQICQQAPTTGILYYWYALTLAAAGDFVAALQQVTRTVQAGAVAFNSRMARRIAVWARESGNYDKVRILFSGLAALAAELQSGRDLIETGLAYVQKLLPQPPQFIQRQWESGLPSARADECVVVPLLNGHFRLETRCLDDQGRTFYSQGVMKYAEEFEPIRCTDVKSKQDYMLTASDLFTLWACGYNFAAASSLIFRKLVEERRTPSVAFTIPAASTMSGGAAIAYRFANWLCDLGVCVTVYSEDKPPAWAEVKAEFKQIAVAAERYRAIAEDIVIAFSVLELPHLLRYHKRPKRIFHLAQVVEDFHYHGYSYESLNQPKGIFRILHSLPVGRIAVSQHIRDYLQEHFQQEAYLVENGIDLCLFRPVRRREIVDRLTILTVGHPERLLKGVAEVRSALIIFARENPSIHVQLIVASAQAVSMASRLSPSVENVSITYLSELSCEQMAELYGRADVYVNGAWYEGFGLPSVEAMASGVPVVQTDNMGLNGRVKHGVNCLLVPPAQPKAIAQALKQLVEDPDLRAKLVRNGLRTAGELSESGQFQAFIQAFQEILMCKFNEARVRELSLKLENGDASANAKEASRELRPLLSVVVPAFENLEWLQATIESVLVQTYHNIEIIVLHEASHPDALACVERFSAADRRVSSRLTSGKNLAGALNQGVTRCAGEWIFFLPPGSIFSPERIAALFFASEFDPEEKLFYTQLYLRIQETGAVREAVPGLRESAPGKQTQLAALFERQLMQLESVMIHRSAFDEIGMFDDKYAFAPDLDFWLRWHLRQSSCFLHSEKGKVEKIQRNPESGHVKNVLADNAAALKSFLKRHGVAAFFGDKGVFTQESISDVCVQIGKALRKPQAMINRTGQRQLLSTYLQEWLANSCPQEWLPLATNCLRRQAADFPTDGRPATARAKISIIMLIHNQLDYTQKCLQSLEKYTTLPHEIIIIDNGSDAETGDYLQHYATNRTDVILIRNRANRGFAAGNNQGLDVATGEFILLMNNDTLVTANWLERMYAVFDAHPEVGLVGPVSNYVSGPQLIKDTVYDTVDQMQKFAKRWAVAHESEVVWTPRLVGFFLLIRREVVRAIGGLDEKFGSGNFEDDDFCLRAALAGFKSCIAYGVFVHHHGNRTFKGMGLDYEKSIRRNWQTFKVKWHLPPDLPYGSPYSIPIQEGENSGLFLPTCGQKNDDAQEAGHYSAINTTNACVRQLYERALGLAGQNEPDKAVGVLREALQLEPLQFEVLVLAGDIYAELSKASEALAFWRQAQLVHPDNDEVAQRIAGAANRASRSADVRRWLSEGRALLEKGELAPGLTILSKILDVDPNHGETIELMSDVYRKMGKQDEAESVRKLSIKNDSAGTSRKKINI